MLAKCFRAGTTVVFSESLPAYPVEEGWEVYVIFHLPNEIGRVELSSGSERVWNGTISPSLTENWEPGIYQAFLLASKGEEKEVIREMSVSVLPNPLSTDRRLTRLQKELEMVTTAIEAVLEGKGVKSYQIQTTVGNRQLERMDLSELRRHKNYLEGKVEEEAVRMGTKKRSSRWRPVGVKFHR